MGYGVLVVDDSAFMRVAISRLIEQHPEFYVVGVARNGLDAVDRVKRLQPAVVTMDVQMPKMDGLAAVREIMSTYPVPIMMLSSLTGVGTDTTIQALQLGAVDCFSKESLISDTEQTVIAEFFERLLAATTAEVKSTHHPSRSTISEELPPQVSSMQDISAKSIDAVIIGCSTGGPAALQSILPQLPKSLPVPVIVAQHMPPGFTKPLAERFNRVCRVPVKEAEDGEHFVAGKVYIAPAGVQTILRQESGQHWLKLTTRTPVETRFKPSVDVTLLSMVPIFRHRLLAVILTGMGNDGTVGCRLLKESGGHVVAQSQASCVVYGMPRSVIEAGYADNVVTLDDVAAHLTQFF